MRKKINGDLVNAIQKAIENCGSQSELAETPYNPASPPKGRTLPMCLANYSRTGDTLD